MNYYIYTIRNGRIFYERTTGSKHSAVSICSDYRKSPKVSDSFYTKDRIIKGCFI